MEYRYKLSDRALLDSLAIYEWIAEYSPERAEKWYRKLFVQIDTLRIFPLRCPLAPEGEKSGEDIRQLIYGKRQSVYRILFTVREDVVTIIAILHAARGPSAF